jgi:transcription antitermination factor NusG
MTIDKDGGRRWLAAYTRSRHEKAVALQLESKALPCLLPTYTRYNRWSDRVRRSQSPLFPGYVFVHVNNTERVPVLETSGVVYLVSSAGKLAVIADEEIARLQACVGLPSEVEPHPYLNLGQQVRVKHGPFAGWDGILVQKQNARRLVISVEQIMRSVAINLHGADVEPVN